jgi:hypothetical protein
MREGREQLRLEMRALHQQALSSARILHEEIIDRLKLLGERRRQP